MKERMMFKRIIALAVLVCFGICLSFAGTNALSATLSPSQLVAQALQNAQSGGWVHERVHATEKGHAFSANNDIGTSEGRQEIQSDGSQAEVVLINGNAYIQANAEGVAHYFKLPSADPTSLAGKWITVTPADSDYSAVIAAVTLKSDFGLLKVVGPYTRDKEMTVDGQRVIPVHGFVSGGSSRPNVAATLYVAASGKLLPIELLVSTKSVKETEVWSNWGQPVPLGIPLDVLPFPQ